MSAFATRPPRSAPPGAWGNRDLLRLNAYSFGISGFILAMDTVVIPVLVLGVAPEAAKNTLLGVLGLVGLAAAAVVQVPVGWASDRTRSRIGRRLPYLLWACVCIPIGLAGLALPLNYGSLLVVWLFIQINAGIGYSPYLASVRELVPVSRMGASASVKTMLEASGGAIVLFLASMLIGRYEGPETAYWLWAMLGLFGLVIFGSAGITFTAIYGKMRRSGGPYTSTFRRAAMSFPESTAMSRLHPDLGWFVVSRGATLGAVVIFTTYGLFFLREKVQVDNPAQALGVAIIGIGGMLVLTTYPAGWVSDRVGRKPVLTVGYLLSVAATLGMIWANTYLLAVLVACVIGGAVGIVLSAHWAMANDLGTRGREGQHMGIVNLGSVAGAAGAKIMGPLPDLVTVWYGPGLGYTALLAASALLFLIGGALTLKVRVNRPGVQRLAVPEAGEG